MHLFRLTSGVGDVSKGFIIEWKKGLLAAQPDGVQRYEITFHSKCLPPERDQKAVCDPGTYFILYKASYGYNPASGQGFVYLPAWGEDDFRYNTRMLLGYGFEGNWSYASSEWESFVRPRIAQAASH